MTIEQAILEKVRSLSPDKQQKILDFAESLVQESQTSTKRQWSSEFLSTFGAWEGELAKTSQEIDERGWPIGFFERIYGICADDPIVIDGGGILEEMDDDMEGVFD
jgi:Protein of unknown function (DUF2281)